MKKIEAIKELIKHLDKYPTSEKEEKNLEYRSKMIEGKINKLKKSDVLIERYFYQGWGVDEGKYFMKVEVPRQTRPRDVWIIRGPWDNGTEEIKIPMKTFLRSPSEYYGFLGEQEERVRDLRRDINKIISLIDEKHKLDTERYDIQGRKHKAWYDRKEELKCYVGKNIFNIIDELERDMEHDPYGLVKYVLTNLLEEIK